MLNRIRLLACSLLTAGALGLAAASPAISQAKPDTSVAGNWQGTLDLGGSKLRVVFHISVTDSNTLTATLDSPDQGATGIPVESVTTPGDSLVMDVAAARGRFEGAVSADGSSVTGTWKQMGGVLPLTLNRTTEVITFNRPQEPKPPYPYKSEDVTYDNTEQEVRLAGTLTLPETGGPFPAAILITGSGPENRNEELFGHKPFLVIADYLTRRGIAVLRVDDRGVGGSTRGSVSNPTTADYATDVMAGIDYLRTRSDIDHSKIGLIGHSEGGIIAPMVAAQSEGAAFVVMLAGTGYSGDRIIVEQTRLLEKADGTSEDEIDRDDRHTRQVISIIESEDDSSAVAGKLADFLASIYSEWGAKLSKTGVDSAQLIDRRVESMTSPWFRYFLTYDPAPALEQVKCPVLAMGGTLDLQVPAGENLEAIGEALKRGGNPDYTTRLISGLNHLFQDAKTGSLKEYSKIEETFSPTALKIMGDWITERFLKQGCGGEAEHR